MNAHLPALGLAVLLVLAGCLGSPAPATETPSSTTPAGQATTAPTDGTTTTTTTTTTDRPTTQPTTTTWTPTTNPVAEEDVVAYGNLSPATQRLFDTELAGGIDRFGVDAGAFRPFVVNDYVRRNDTLYAVDGYRTLDPRSVVVGLRTVDGESVENASNVVAYANLSASVQGDFDALRNGSKSSLKYIPDEFPFPGEPIGDRESYVTVDGEYYRLVMAHADVYEYRITVSNASEN